jgi:hypothetical protein
MYARIRLSINKREENNTMNTYANLKIVIAGGKKSKENLMSMLDVFLKNDRITSDQYNELVVLVNA